MLHCAMHLSSTKGGLPLLSLDSLTPWAWRLRKPVLFYFCWLLNPRARLLLDAARPWKEVCGQSRSNLARCPAFTSCYQAVEERAKGQSKLRQNWVGAKPSAFLEVVRSWIEVNKANSSQFWLGAHTAQAFAFYGAGFPWLLATAFCLLA